MPRPVEPPSLIPLPGVACASEACDKPLAWRAGVGRYVISHADGDDLCSRETARIAESDDVAAQLAFEKADADYVAAIAEAVRRD